MGEGRFHEREECLASRCPFGRRGVAKKLPVPRIVAARVSDRRNAVHGVAPQVCWGVGPLGGLTVALSGEHGACPAPAIAWSTDGERSRLLDLSAEIAHAPTQSV